MSQEYRAKLAKVKQLRKELDENLQVNKHTRNGVNASKIFWFF